MRPPSPWILRLCWALACAGVAVWPPAAVAADGERAQLAQQRRQLAEAFTAEERACSQRFAVTACVDAVRQRRREALAPLRERELRLDEAERAQRASERRAAIEAKRAAAAAAPPAASSVLPELRVRPPATAASRPPPRPRDEVQDDRAAQAEQRQRQARQRRDEAASAQERVQRRLAEREASGRKADPLPVPPAGSAPQR